MKQRLGEAPEKSPENEKFVAAYKKRWDAGKVTHFVSEACYFQT
jgi:urea transport system substrate-binding protein